MDSYFSKKTVQKKKFTKKLIYFISFFVFCGLFVLLFLYQYIFGSVVLGAEKIITIPDGYSLHQTSELLVEEGVLNSKYSLLLINKTQEISVKAGDYIFSGAQYPMNVAERLTNAEYGDVYKKITIPEGSTNKQIAHIIKNSPFIFDQEVFDTLTQDTEGYLFPDTYSLLPSATTEDIIEILKNTFESKIKPLNTDIKQSSRSLEDIIIMASIIEKEATGDVQEQKIVSGILWKRLDEGKLLQVDAPFQYIHGQVRASDLRKDGPYNTYTRLGLTPTPIGNPGISAINAAINPIQSPYYFYLHGKDGSIHYGVTYDQHINNINRYLR